MTATTTPAPRSLCAAFAPLLPLISSGALEDAEATPTREHVAGCDWCQQEVARYAAVDEALRREFGAGAHASVLPFLFDLDGDEDIAEDFAFTLEDTLEETMAEGHNPRDQQPSTTTRSSRWSDRKGRPSPRATAIAGIAAALILAVIATAVYTQFAARHTTSSPAATKTSSAFIKVALPNANTLFAWTTGSDGSFWYANSALSASHSAEIGHVTPDGTITTFPIPADDAVTSIEIHGMAVGSDGDLWFGGSEGHGTTFTSLIWRMTPSEAFSTIALPADLTIGRMIAGPDGALWFAGTRGSETQINLIGRITMDGQITTFSTPSQSKDAGFQDFCVGPDNAIWYTWVDSFTDPSKVTGRIGRVSPSGQIQEFTVPYAPGSIASGADGALWYSEFASSSSGNDLTRKGYIGRITTAGVASELPIDLNTGIGQLVAGSDGAIWYIPFPDQAGGFGRITPSGGVKKLSTGGNAQIDLFAAVPGALWLFDSRNNLWHYRLPA